MDIAADLWSELKRYIPVSDRNEAADLMISLLIDNDYGPTEIRSAFKGDNDVKQALQSYLDDATGDDDEDDSEEFDEDDHEPY
jgi:hypothetical protein